MSERPAALDKAESLHSYATSQGSPLSTFALALSDDEGIELCDYLVQENPGSDLLAYDVAEAKRKRNPWPVLDNFVLMGLSLCRRDELH